MQYLKIYIVLLRNCSANRSANTHQHKWADIQDPTINLPSHGRNNKVNAPYEDLAIAINTRNKCLVYWIDPLMTRGRINTFKKYL